MKFKVADFVVEYEFEDKALEKVFNEYACEDMPADLHITVTADEIDHNMQISEQKLPRWSYEDNILHRKIAEQLPLYNAFVLHSATFDINGTGVAFSARSGTGKTTHLRLWQQYLGEKLKIVNGDKPVVRFADGTVYAYGTRWNGKERLGTNMRTELKHICFIERSAENYVEPLESGKAIERIFKQVYLPDDPMARALTVPLIDKLLNSCKLWVIHCNMDISAAKTAYETIFSAD